MEYALRVDGDEDEHVTLVTIWEERKSGIDVVKTRRYKCPNENCLVPVFPAFPTPPEEHKSQAPRAYFRSGTRERHINGCIKDEGVARLGKDKKQRKGFIEKGQVSAGEIPTRLIRHLGNRVRGAGKKQHKEGRGTPKEDWDDSLGYRESEASSVLVREFVESYERLGEGAKSHGIKIPGCRALRYEDAFVPAEQGVAKGGYGGVFIYYGEFLKFKAYFSGVLIYFSSMAFDGNELGVWVSRNLRPETTFNEILERCRVAKDCSAKVYALGTFMWTHGHYAIEVRNINDVWITY